jgi:hypothetical protein
MFREPTLFCLRGVKNQLRQKAIAILALFALLLGAIPALTGELLAMPASCACCQSNLCPMHRPAKSSGRPLCTSHPLNEAAPCNMACCHPQTTHALSGTPFVPVVPSGISGPALAAFGFSQRPREVVSFAREVTPRPPRTILT